MSNFLLARETSVTFKPFTDFIYLSDKLTFVSILSFLVAQKSTLKKLSQVEQ